MNSAVGLRLLDLRSQKPGIEKEIAEIKKNLEALTQKLKNSSESGITYQIAKGKLEGLNSARQALFKQQRDTQLYTDNALGSLRSPRG